MRLSGKSLIRPTMKIVDFIQAKRTTQIFKTQNLKIVISAMKYLPRNNIGLHNCGLVDK